jgi:hypothetical protein
MKGWRLVGALMSMMGTGQAQETEAIKLPPPETAGGTGGVSFGLFSEFIRRQGCANNEKQC